MKTCGRFTASIGFASAKENHPPISTTAHPKPKWLITCVTNRASLMCHGPRYLLTLRTELEACFSNRGEKLP